MHSFETWIDDELAGGLYGVSLGRMFFGESMFAHRTDASKIALAALVAFCRARGIETIDCQQRTSISPRSVDGRSRGVTFDSVSARLLRASMSPIGPMICACGSRSGSNGTVAPEDTRP